MSSSRGPLGRATSLVVAVVGGVALVAACGAGGSSGSGAGEPAGRPGEPASVPPASVSVGRGLRPVVDAAVAELATAVPRDDVAVRVVLARRETFPDAALGCPEPGKSYTQALVDGFRVVLARGDRFWLFTAGPDRVPRLCRSAEGDGGTGSPPPGID